MFGEVIRRLARRVIRTFARRRTIVLATVLLAVLVAGGFGVFQVAGMGGPAILTSSTGGRAPASAEAYLRGTAEYNAREVWESLSPEALENLSSRVGGLEGLQRQLESSKQQGFRLDQITYVGGTAVADGTSYHFYVVRTRSPLTRGEPEYVPYTFVLDRSGKISRIL